MPMKIIRNDITKISVDATVNPSNNELKMGGGVSGAIFSAAGSEKLQEECDTIGKCNVGEAVITNGYNLPSKYIIHTVGPVWRGGNSNEAKLLHNCYKNSMGLALKYECKSIAFPLISSGTYGYPKDEALQIAVSAISEFLLEHDMMVYLVVYDKKSYVVSQRIFTEIEKFIDDNYIEEKLSYENSRSSITYAFSMVGNAIKWINQSKNASECSPIGNKKRSLEDVINNLDESFSQRLLRLIDEKGMTDVEAYKRANIDRKLFSKIRSDKGYKPRKITAIAFAVSLKLNLDEALDLLGSAGYTLSHSNKFDVIIEYFISERNYNIHEINQILFHFGFEKDLLGV